MQTKYSIKDLERLSGIKAHTIRIWEQRYKILQPERGGRNIRSYSNDQLRKLLNINFLHKQGFKISNIASLSETDLSNKLSVEAGKITFEKSTIENLLLAMIEMNCQEFEDIIKDYTSNKGFELCIEELLFPFLTRIGIMWQAGDVNPIQEHFISNIIRQKIISEIDRLPNSMVNKSKALILFLPEGEWHELSLLFCSFLLRKQNIYYYYLGQSVPLDNLKNTIEFFQNVDLITIVTKPLDNLTLGGYTDVLANLKNVNRLYISGFQLFQHHFSSNHPKVNIFQSPQKLIQKLIS